MKKLVTVVLTLSLILGITGLDKSHVAAKTLTQTFDGAYNNNYYNGLAMGDVSSVTSHMTCQKSAQLMTKVQIHYFEGWEGMQPNFRYESASDIGTFLGRTWYADYGNQIFDFCNYYLLVGGTQVHDLTLKDFVKNSNNRIEELPIDGEAEEVTP